MAQIDNLLKALGALIRSNLPTLQAVNAVSREVILEIETKHFAQFIPRDNKLYKNKKPNYIQRLSEKHIFQDISDIKMYVS